MDILYALESIRNPVMTAIMSAVTYLGDEMAFIAIAIIVYWCVSKKYGYYLMATGMIGTSVNQFLKIVCRVPRPWVRDPDFTIVESARAAAGGYSFPSGHTQNAVGIIGGTARFSTKKAVRIVCIVLAALVAFSRMYLGVHYPSDVVFGIICGLALVFVLYPMFEKFDDGCRPVTILFGVTAAISLIAALFVELHSWPAGTDAMNLAESTYALYMIAGCTLALTIGVPIEAKHIGFDTKAPWWAQILKAVLGLALVMGLRAGLKPGLAAIIGALPIAGGVRYFICVLFVVLVWPQTFPWFSKGCPLRKAKPASDQ